MTRDETDLTDEKAAPEDLERLVKDDGFRGVRLSPSANASGDWIGGPLMPPLWRRAQQLKTPMLMLTSTPRLPQVAKLIEQVPDLDVCIHHMADCPLDRPDELKKLLDLARYPRVFVKISHTWSISKQPYPYTDTHDQVKKVYDVGGGVGGPIVKDKLWFYTALRSWGNDIYVPGAFYPPTRGGARFVPDQSRRAFTAFYQRDSTTRVTYQAAEKHRFTGQVGYQHSCNCNYWIQWGIVEQAATVDYLFGYDATAGVVADWMYETLAQTYALDPENQQFLREANPWALRGIVERLSEAADRGLWAEPDPSTMQALQQAYLDVEGDLEDRG